MKKKELAQLPVRQAQKEDITLANRTLAVTYFVYAEKIELNDAVYLILSFYSRSKLISNETQAEFRVFFCGDDYITQYFTEKTSWRKGRISYIMDLYNWENYTVSLNEESEKILRHYFCPDKETVDKGVFYEIEKFQNNILNQRLGVRHQKEMEQIDQKMELIPELPNDFESWCDESALFKSRYIFYQKRNGDNPVQGYCTCCHKTVSVTAPRHNHYGICPMCGKNIQYKVEGRSKNIIDFATAALLQPLENGFTVRYFRIWKKYKSDYRNPELKCFEEIRCFYHKEGIKTYLFDYFKQTNILRWCRSNRDFYLTNTSVYPNTIDASLENTKWEYSGLKDFISLDGSIVNLPDYLSAYLKHPYIEKLVKVGLRHLAVDVIDSWNFMPMNPKSHSLLDMLGITRSELRGFKELDISESGYTFFMKAKSKGISLTPEIFREYEQYGTYKEEILDYLKYSTFHKVNKYLHLKCKTEEYKIKTAWVLWRDYIQLCEHFQYDLKNDFYLFPKHLRQSHDRLTNRLNAEKRKLHQKEKKKQDCKAKKRFAELKNQLEWENKNYAILVPQSYEEFEQEGSTLHTCVGNQYYYKEMANGNTIVLFLRKKSEIEKPFYTLELREQKIVQSQTFGNAKATEEIEKVIHQFLKEKVVVSSDSVKTA